jgi:pyruvate/2-oxoacid:ferredoxin oxidoreductase alpha subunit
MGKRWAARVAAAGYLAEKAYSVAERYVAPAFRTYDGKLGWFTESGKCWVSRASAAYWR